MADKKTHFGRAGEYFAMSELLLRGWNVAVPVVDVGDDVFVIDDNDKTTRRLQVKTSETEPVKTRAGAMGVRARFTLSRVQLSTAQQIELFYMLLLRVETRWRFLVVPRADLAEVRNARIASATTRSTRGRKPLPDDKATRDELGLEIVLAGDDAKGWKASGWGASLSAYLDRWPADLREVRGGPGSAGTSAASAPTASSAQDPAPSQDPGT
jgi:hypothetical protein